MKNSAQKIISPLFTLILFFFLSTCDNKGSIEGTKERAAAEQQAGKEVETSYLTKKAKHMEEDLSNLHYFYGALEGEYLGRIKVDQEEYNIKFIFTRSLPPYTGTRVRELSEIETDLNNLYLNIKIIQWHSSDPRAAVACPAARIKPHRDEGTIVVAVPECTNLYSISISETAGPNQRAENSKSLALKIKNRELSSVPYLLGTLQPSSLAFKYEFHAKKILR